MKIDRLMSMLLYLLGHGTVSAATLAARYEVSKRTIQRDIDTLCQAGVPIVSSYGAEGGYRVMEGFTVDRRLLSSKDIGQLTTALQGLRTASGKDTALQTLSGMEGRGHTPQRIFMDLSTARESSGMDEALTMLELAIDVNRVVRIVYAGAGGHISERDIEPLALTYRWYAWYVFAYCRLRAAYRLFKVVRMHDIRALPETFAPPETDIESLMRANIAEDARPMVSMRLLCRAAVRGAIREYLTGNVTEELAGGDFVYVMHAPVGERMWFSLLLGFGDMIEVLEPLSLREAIQAQAAKILTVYGSMAT